MFWNYLLIFTTAGRGPVTSLGSTKAKLSYLEAGSAFRDPHSPLTPAANLFPSGGSFFWGGRHRISTQWSRCWWLWRAISYFHQSLLSLGLEPLLHTGRLRPSSNQPVCLCELAVVIKSALKKLIALQSVQTRASSCCFFLVVVFLRLNTDLKSRVCLKGSKSRLCRSKKWKYGTKTIDLTLVLRKKKWRTSTLEVCVIGWSYLTPKSTGQKHTLNYYLNY